MILYTRKVKEQRIADQILDWLDTELIPASYSHTKRWYIVRFELAPTDKKTYDRLKKYVKSIS